MTSNILFYPARSEIQDYTPNHIITISTTDDFVSAAEGVHSLIK